MDTHHGYDYDAMMKSNISDFGTVISTDVTTLAGGAVNLNVGRTFYRDPAAPRWMITIVAEDVVEDDEDPAVTGHVCSCGNLHEHAGEGDDSGPCLKLIDGQLLSGFDLRFWSRRTGGHDRSSRR